MFVNYKFVWSFSYISFTYFFAVWSSIRIRLSAGDREGDSWDWKTDELLESFPVWPVPVIYIHKHRDVIKINNCDYYIPFVVITLLGLVQCNLPGLLMLSIFNNGNCGVVDISIKLLSPADAMLWLRASVDPLWLPLWNNPRNV